MAGAAVVVGLPLLWQLLVTASGVPPYILPGPAAVMVALGDHAALILDHAGTTLVEVLAGLVIGIGLGVSTALVMQVSAAARRVLLPLILFSQAVPVFALAPLLTLWLGYGMAAKVTVALLIVYFPVASSFYDGLAHTPRGWLDLAATMQAPPLRTMLWLRVPAALPQLASGMRIAAVYAPIGAVIGEWVGASRGLGYLMLWANGQVRIDLMFAALTALALMTLGLHAAVDRLARILGRRARGLQV